MPLRSFEVELQETLYARVMHHGSEAAAEMRIRSDLEVVEKRLKGLLWRTILDDENASVILYGCPGSGKSLVVERVLAEIEKKCHRRNEETPVMCIIRLGGVLDGDKREGFKSIARQLCAFMNVKFVSHISTEQNIQFVKSALAKLHQAQRSCVFVLDAFERFVKDKQKQEIVYTLLDVLQLKNVRSCVIGMTSDFRIKSDFDKRVNSRFSHKSWTLPKCDDIVQVLFSMLTVPSGGRDHRITKKYNKSLRVAADDPRIQEIGKTQSGHLNPRDARDIAILAVAHAMARSQKLFKILVEDLLSAYEQCIKRYDSFPIKISELSVPHLYTLVACYKLSPRFTSKAVFTKYDCFRRTQNTTEVYDRPIMIHAFEDLFNDRLIARNKETKYSSILLSPMENFTLNVTRREIERGIAANPRSSTVLTTFFKSA